MNQNSDELQRLLTCDYCGQKYTKNNKPLVMKCTHNICTDCHKINIKNLVCIKCKQTYDAKASKNLPINYLLKDTLEKAYKTPETELDGKIVNEKETLYYHCNDCNINFYSKDFHLKNFPDHIFTEQISISQEDIDPKVLMQRYQDFNKDFTDAYQIFFKFIYDQFIENTKQVVKEHLDKNDILENLSIFGIINQADKERIKEFESKYSKNSNIKAVLRKSENFEDFINNFPKDENINEFLSLHFYIHDIALKKLGDFETRLEEFKKRLDKNETNELFNHFINDIFIILYDKFNTYKTLFEDPNRNAWILHENILYLFDTINEQLQTYNLSEQLKDLTDFNYTVDELDLYIIGGKAKEDKDNNTNNFFKINLEDKNITKLPNLPLIETENYKFGVMIARNKIYVMSKKLFAEYDIVENKWKSLPNVPLQLENNPFLLKFEPDYIYAFDNLKNFAYLELSKKKWVVSKPLYKDEFPIYLQNFIALYHKENVVFIGGIYENKLNKNEKHFNKNIYFMDDGSQTLTLKGKFPELNENTLISHGYNQSNHFILALDINTKTSKILLSSTRNPYSWSLKQ